MTKTVSALLALLFVLSVGCGDAGDIDRQAQQQAIGNWTTYGFDKANTKHSPLSQINRENVDRLKVAWRWSSPENDLPVVSAAGSRWIYESTPLAVDGILYATSSVGHVAAIRGDSGETIWTFDAKVYESGKGAHGIMVNRGASLWDNGDERRLILGTKDARLIALDLETGQPIEGFGEGGSVDLTRGLRRTFDARHYSVSSPPIIVGDVIVVGSSVSDAFPKKERAPGDVRGFDVRTGEQLWVFESVPQPGQFGHETWENGSWEYTGNTNVWTIMSADEELGYVYLPFSTPTNDWYGGNRHGDNLFAESLVCLDARTGERIWHFQMVHHGLWDYDLGSAPNLVDIEVDGKPIKAVAQVSKQGWVYVFDRVTGEPVWPIEERPVPASTVPGEKAAATQPFPTRPPAFERQGFTEDDLIDFTPDIRKQALETVSQYDMGPIFTPPTERGLLYLPGALGGANWHGAAFDADSGVLFVPSITRLAKFKIIPTDPAESDAGYRWESLNLEGPGGLPLTKPPYGRITAIDLNRGEHLWMVPLGEGPRNHPLLKDLNLPRLGWSLRGAPLLTGGLLFIGQEGDVWRHFRPMIDGSVLTDPTEEIAYFEPKFSAFDQATGELVWEMDMFSNVHGAPMTYLAGGKQYIAVAIGGVTRPAELVALALE